MPSGVLKTRQNSLDCTASFQPECISQTAQTMYSRLSSQQVHVTLFKAAIPVHTTDCRLACAHSQQVCSSLSVFCSFYHNGLTEQSQKTSLFQCQINAATLVQQFKAANLCAWCCIHMANCIALNCYDQSCLRHRQKDFVRTQHADNCC